MYSRVYIGGLQKLDRLQHETYTYTILSLTHLSATIKIAVDVVDEEADIPQYLSCTISTIALLPVDQTLALGV
jgi:hypothetical protein